MKPKFQLLDTSADPQAPAAVQSIAAKIAAAFQEVKKMVDQIGVTTTGKALPSIDLTTSVTAVPHGLGSVANGHIVTYQTSGVFVWPSQRPDETYIYLQASGAVTVDLWVF